jgi:hypothetical protein
MADTAGPGHEPRVAKLEANVAHMRGDIADIFVIVRLVGVPLTTVAPFCALRHGRCGSNS